MIAEVTRRAGNQPASFLIEPLEQRQLLSLVVDVRAGDGSTSAIVDHVGQVLNLQLWAVITGVNNDPSQDGLADLIGSLLSSGTGYKPVKGNLAAANAPGFDASGAQPGTPTDLNGDGNLDVGSNDSSSNAGFFDTRADPIASISSGTVVGGSLEFDIGTLTYTVTDLNMGGETDVVFRPQAPFGANLSASWVEDNTGKDNFNGSFTGGTPFKITAPSVFPTGPIAIDDSFGGAPGQSSTVDILANDFDDTGTIDPTTVTIISQPNHGGTASVDPLTGQATYTAPANFVGAETFTYTVRDDKGLTSPVGTVTFSDTLANLPAPVANDDSVSTVLSSPVTIDIAANDTAAAPATLQPSSIAIVAPAHGTATLTANDTVLYTPNDGFVGADAFTYTIGDSNGKTSNSATVNVNVGVDVGGSAAGHRLVSFTDADGTRALVTLNRGTAVLQFSQSTATISANGAVVTITGPAMLGDIALAGTTAQSVLSIRAFGGDAAVQVGNITGGEAIAMNAIVAPSANLVGNLDVGGLSVLVLRNIGDATRIHIGATGAASVAIVLGAVGAATLASDVPIRLLSVRSWQGGAVAAPSLTTLVARGDFSAALTLTSAGAAPALNVASIGGSLAGGAWAINGGARTIVAGSVSAGWSSNITGSLSTMVVRTGGLASSMTVGGIGAITVVGDLTGSINVNGSARVMHVTGSINGGSITTGSDLLTLIAGSMQDATIRAGSGAVLFGAATSAAAVGAGRIQTILLTGRTGKTFSDSTIVAGTIATAILGTVNTANTGPSGLAAAKFSVVAIEAGSEPMVFGPRQLKSDQDLLDFVADRDIDTGNFQIQIAS